MDYTTIQKLLYEFGAAKFIGATLTDVKFVRTNIDDTNFSSATLERVSFYAGAKGGVLFDNAKGRDIKGGRTDGLKFNGAKLKGGSFTDLNLVFADFSHAEITGMKLVNVRFLSPKFDDAEIIGMDFTDSEVDKADILKARVVCNVKLKDDFIDRDCSQEFKDCELPKYAPKGRICE